MEKLNTEYTVKVKRINNVIQLDDYRENVIVQNEWFKFKTIVKKRGFKFIVKRAFDKLDNFTIGLAGIALFYLLYSIIAINTKL